MGFFEQILGYGVIPSMLVTLFLLAMKSGRRTINNVINKVFGLHIDCGGVRIQLVPLMTFINIIYAANCLTQIEKLTEQRMQDAQDHHKDIVEGLFIQQLYRLYRNLVMNICCIILLVCISIATWQYTNYAAIKEKADAIVKARK